MSRCKLNFVWILIIFTTGTLFLTGCMAAKPTPGEIFPCAKDSNVNKTIAPQASLENFSCVFKKWDGADTLHFNLTVKNISNEDQRFKINIFLKNGKAVGGLLPRKIKKGLIKPGESATFSYPVKSMNCAPGKIDLLIKTMDK